MKISASENYWHEYDCPLGACARHYCNLHRFLWRDCETVQKGVDDVYLNGRLHFVYELGDCPECEHQYFRQRLERLAEAQNGQQRNVA